ncbi:sterol desaturase family protein [Protofrankia coriariae]|uniref:Fatty acid hydroxylase n=1 Tax=Protofrankia coriariae TaxID=1562887 RepID=A0ABR5F8R9_9ACTN|nr:sterol desaturase family protein [Protofrankia coriariae]KLL13072.1 fatty acid hydroxylase [Protofrankia coriariae]
MSTTSAPVRTTAVTPRRVAPRWAALHRAALHRVTAAVARLDRPGPHGRASEATTLRAAANRFVTHPRPPVLLGVVASLAAMRLARGRFSRTDAVVAVSMAAAQPFVEWGVHRGILHARPGSRAGAVCYRIAGWGHEQHHRDPTNMDTMFIRPQEVLDAGAAALAVALVGPPPAATAALCTGLGLLAYDWTHFLIHTGYRPRGRMYRRIWRNHRLHHFRNERYWLGVTSNIGDVLLGTNPPRDAVPVSPTAAYAHLPAQ